MRLLLVALFSMSLVFVPNNARALSNPCDDLDRLNVALVVVAASAGSISGKIRNVIDKIKDMCDEMEIVIGGMKEMENMGHMTRASLGGIEKRVESDFDSGLYGAYRTEYEVIREDIYTAGQAANRELLNVFDTLEDMQHASAGGIETQADVADMYSRIDTMVGDVEAQIDDASAELADMRKRIDLIRRDVCVDSYSGARAYYGDVDGYDNIARECR